MTVRQAGAPVTDADLNQAAMQGMGKIMDAEFANRAGNRWLCRLIPKLTFFFDGTGNNLDQELE
jgi:hypothetical protein